MEVEISDTCNPDMLKLSKPYCQTCFAMAPCTACPPGYPTYSTIINKKDVERLHVASPKKSKDPYKPYQIPPAKPGETMYEQQCRTFTFCDK